ADYLEPDTLAGCEPFDLVISNPPYGKISPRDARGGDSPNLYTRFMEVGAGQLRPGGELICIVPRSFTSGSYFRRFRARFHAAMALEQMHVFASRRAAFASDGVLQETVIFRYRKREPGRGELVRVTSCDGVSPGEVEQEVQLPREQVLAGAESGAALYIPKSGDDVRLLARLRGLRQRIEAFGCQVSTGKIVPFRSRPQLRATSSPGETVPLLWMQHVQAGRIHWPLGGEFSKPEHILETAPGLVPNQNLVVIRRLSSKDEARRITATVIEKEALPGRVWGLENHLNYLYRVGGELSLDEAWGLMTYLNSEPVDRYVRITNGHTQVNASELRALPMPEMALLRGLGRDVRAQPSAAATLVEAAIDHSLSKVD
ncbi:MAG: Eco57I restriction-modification methylase domain-containing protein, partial [Nannocystaceae bacterium]